MNPRTATPATVGEAALLRRYLVFIILVWTLVAAGFTLFVHLDARRQARNLALAEARAAYNKDLVYRRWAASHGGIYVPVSEETQPNPYLAHVPGRDITTSGGRSLTLMNPAYMTRQVHQLAREQYGALGHITSLTPLNPGNAPDPWETQGLQALARGAKEASGVQSMGGRPFMRLMLPVLVEEQCLPCHAAQGYALGDIRGGISSSVPLEPWLASTGKGARDATTAIGTLWLLGIIGITRGGKTLGRRLEEKRVAEMQLQESRALYHDLVDTSQDLIWMCDAEGRYTYLNPAWEEVLGYGVSEMLGRPYTDFIPPEWQGRERLLEERIVKGALLPHMDSNGRQRQLVFNAKTILDPEGAPSGFRGSAYDITERNLLEHELSSKVSELETVLAKVKQLEGILPICMYCKKIRKDTRSWQQLETYISEHSEALFSHSVCPECEGHQRREYDAMKSDRGEGSAP